RGSGTAEGPEVVGGRRHGPGAAARRRSRGIERFPTREAVGSAGATGRLGATGSDRVSAWNTQAVFEGQGREFCSRTTSPALTQRHLGGHMPILTNPKWNLPVAASLLLLATACGCGGGP